jgi:phosphoribosyl-ATP pyrophosphohydrolase
MLRDLHCFEGENMTLNELYEIILNRRDHPTEKSYTASLFAQGLPRLAQKVGEEGTEVVVAALVQENDRLIEEIADLTFHTLVLMAAKNISPAAVLAELARRHM